MGNEKVKAAFREKDFALLYDICPDVINDMLMITSKEEYNDFLQREKEINEEVFDLYYEANTGKSVAVGAFEGDVTAKVNRYFIQKLPNSISEMIRKAVPNWYINIDQGGNLQENVDTCNELLKDLGYVITLKSDSTYCEGVYFIAAPL